MNEQAAFSDRKRNLIFLNIIITCIATTMLSTALTTALPAISNELSVDVSTAQWLTSGYTLVMGIMMPLTAFLMTRFPTKRLYITGAACLLVSNLLTLSVSVDTSIWRVAAYNIIMTAGCGCLLTPLITWGVSGLKQELTSHATALLTSFRTVAGAIGSAVFVGLMEVLSERSTNLSETAASIHGFSGVFGIMAIFSAIMLCIPVFFLRKQK